MKKKKVPSKLKPFLWSKSIDTLDKEKDKVYIIHQILSYGDLKELKLLFRLYDRTEIRNVFLRFPKIIYQPSVFYFVKKIILEIKSRRLKEEDYVKTLF